jgi:hypothetical protein
VSHPFTDQELISIAAESVCLQGGADIRGHLTLVGASDQMLKPLACLTESQRAVEVQRVIVIHLSARTGS